MACPGVKRGKLAFSMADGRFGPVDSTAGVERGRVVSRGDGRWILRYVVVMGERDVHVLEVLLHRCFDLLIAVANRVFIS